MKKTQLDVDLIYNVNCHSFARRYFIQLASWALEFGMLFDLYIPIFNAKFFMLFLLNLDTDLYT